MIGGWVATIVPSSGIVTLGVRQQLEQERLEVVVGAVDLVDQQHRGPRAGVLERAQQRPPDEVVRAEQLLLAQRRAARVGEPDAQQLTRVVPLVQRLRRVDPLVALQADQRRVEHGGQRPGRLGLADARLALEQQRLGQAQAEEHRRREALVDEVVHAGQALGQRLDVGHEPADLAGRLARDLRRAHAAARAAEDRLVVLRGVDVERDRARRPAPRATSPARSSSSRQTPLSPCRPASVARRRCARTRSGGRARRRSGRRPAARRRGRPAAPRRSPRSRRAGRRASAPARRSAGRRRRAPRRSTTSSPRRRRR